ncbi:hypothetical protein Clacol_005207 [Clathrus columnatus]|uniref:Uncharacterized protein n=1 Tax=Clathrus columnatus TaxID=1419009 RepID=A0AAV5AE86_9AGAM|nr:hypothetical protein Clacol_005207 [Clathrus columnatus]
MPFKYHIVFICAPSWGHCRPSVPISFKIVKERPDILVTYPVVGKFKERMDREIERYCTGENKILRDNIRVVKISEFDGGELQSWDVVISSLPQFVQKLCVCEPATCFTGRTYPAVPKPNLVLVDFALSTLGSKLLNDKQVDTRIWCWNPASISVIIYIAAPGHLADQARGLAEKTNKSVIRAIIDVNLSSPLLNPSNISYVILQLAANTPNDKVLNLPGLPPAYVHELRGEHHIPGARERWAGLVTQVTDLWEYSFIRQSHGLLMANTPIIEEGGINFAKKWLSDKGCYALGPSMFPVDVEFQKEESSRGQEAVTFLNKVYRTHGRHSLLYISFGTSVFPNCDTPWQLIGIILDMEIPFIFAMPHDDTYENTLPPELRNRLESSELALVAKWAPQQTILNHPVTGIFFTHGGQGGITESLSYGVPMIIWPLQADQPYNAINLTLNLKVAYQLLEVRIDHGLKPLYRGYKPKGTKEAIDTEFRQVLTDAFGSDGDTKRKSAFDISKRLRKTWGERGEAMVELRRMLQENFS